MYQPSLYHFNPILNWYHSPFNIYKSFTFTFSIINVGSICLIAFCICDVGGANYFLHEGLYNLINLTKMLLDADCTVCGMLATDTAAAS